MAPITIVVGLDNESIIVNVTEVLTTLVFAVCVRLALLTVSVTAIPGDVPDDFRV